jgi:hyperosmotically inducible periplasmic protein
MRSRTVHLFSFAIAAALVSAGARPAAADKSQDKRLEKRVEATLKKDERLKDYNLDATVERSVVTLTGKVALDAAKMHAEQVADIEGVKKIDNQIVIDPMTESERLELLGNTQPKPVTTPPEGVEVPKEHIDSPAAQPEPVQLPEPPTVPLHPEKMVGGDVPADNEVSTRVMTKIVDDVTLKGSNVKVEGKGEGVVTLSGTVTSEEAREHAVKAAKTTTGVRVVEDQMKVVGPR